MFPSLSRATPVLHFLTYSPPPFTETAEIKTKSAHSVAFFCRTLPTSTQPSSCSRCGAVFAALSRKNLVRLAGAALPGLRYKAHSERCSLSVLRFFRVANLARGGALSVSGQYRLRCQYQSRSNQRHSHRIPSPSHQGPTLLIQTNYGFVIT